MYPVNRTTVFTSVYLRYLESNVLSLTFSFLFFGGGGEEGGGEEKGKPKKEGR